MINRELNGIDFTIDSNGQNAELDMEALESENGIKLYRIRVKFPEKVTPKKISLTFYLKKDDAISTFKPNDILNSGIRPDWKPAKAFSSAASDSPMIAVIAKSDKNKGTIAFSDCKTPCCLCTGFSENRQKIMVRAELFTALTSPLSEYETLLRIDLRDIPADIAISDVCTWWKTFYSPVYVPETATMPTYAPWYVFHQNFKDEVLLEECKRAKELGMESIIVDDGWQTEDNGGGYAFCGDWKICKSKIADMGKFVKDLHAIGMKMLLWFSVPYMGKNAQSVDRFRGKYLYFDKSVNAYALDPRFKEVREYLVGTYAEYLQKYDLDGFKLDFIDVFYLTEESSVDYENMDYVSLVDAIEALIKEIAEKLKNIKPDILLEFRQHYTGAMMQQFGNMFRIGDCAGGENTLRVCVADLRMLTSGVAVHSDPLIWSYDDPVEYAAYQINHSIFGVPQISVNLGKITDSHRKMLSYHLQYFRDNRQTLLFGKMHAEGFSQNYTALTAQGDTKDITALYGKNILNYSGEKDIDVINATNEKTVYIRSGKPAMLSVKITDCMGEDVTNTKICLHPGLNEMSMPISGFAFIRTQ